MQAGDLAKAKSLLDKAKQSRPRDELILARIATVAQLRHRADEFAAVVAEVEKFDPKPATFFNELANSLEERRLYEDAEIYYKKAIDLREKLAAPRVGLAMVYLRMGKEAEARPLLEKAFQADRFNVRVANSLKVLRHLDKYKTISSEHYDLRYDAATDPVLAGMLLDYLEENHRKLEKDYNFSPRGKFLVELFNSHEMFSGRTVALPDLHTIGAVTGRVMTIASPTARGLLRPFNWGRVVRHELTHLFNLAQTRYQAPHWLTEGLAVRNEGGDKPLTWAGILRDRYRSQTLLTLDTIQLGFIRPRDNDEHTLAYYQANIYVEYVIEMYGLPAIGKILDGYHEGLNDAAVIAYACKTDKAAFEKGYQTYVRKIIEKSGPLPPVVAKAMTADELEAAYQANPDDIELAARLAESYQRRRKPAEARKLADAVLNKSPGHALATIVKVRLLQAAGDDEQVVPLLEKALAAHADDAKLLQMLAKIRLAEKDYRRAAELLEKGRQVAPAEGGWLELLQTCYSELKQNEQLLATLRASVASDADDLAPRVALTKLAFQMERYDEATAAARETLFIDVNQADARRIMLEALAKLGRDAEVAKWKERFAAK